MGGILILAAMMTSALFNLKRNDNVMAIAS